MAVGSFAATDPVQAFAAQLADMRRRIVDLELAAASTPSTLRLGSYYLWIDATGDLRIKSSVPLSDLDGTVVGTQS